jgi:hypothetical protein
LILGLPLLQWVNGDVMDEINVSWDSDDQDTLATGQEQIKECPALHKASRAGGPVTCVAFQTIRSHSTAGTPTIARIWGLGPYLIRSCEDDHREMLVFPETIGGSIHGVSFREELESHRHQRPDFREKPIQFGDELDWDAVVFGGRNLTFCSILQRSEMERFDVYQDGFQKPSLLLTDWIWDVKLI